MLLWTFFGELSQRFNLSPIFVFGFGRGIAALVLSGFGCAADAGHFTKRRSRLTQPCLTLVVMAVIMFAYCLLPNERTIYRSSLPHARLVQAVDAGKYIDAAASSHRFKCFKRCRGSRQGKVEQAALAAERSMGSGNGQALVQRKLRSCGWSLSSVAARDRSPVPAGGGIIRRTSKRRLYISEGTAKTHIRHIYRKLDIHNQQELMRIVENGE